MSWKDLLLYLPADSPAGAASAAGYAAGLAKAFGMEATAIAFAADVPIPISFRNELDVEWRDEQERKNRAAAEAAVVAAAEAFEGQPLAAFVETSTSSEAVEAFVRYARLRDVVVLPNAAGDTYVDDDVTEDVLFESGLPAILVPDVGKSAFALESVMVAWDCTRPAARALADSMPLLKKAGAVHVVSVTDDKSFPLSHDTGELLAHLSRHGVKAQAHGVARGDDGIGEALIREALRLGANLMVMGGYGHSRFRQFVLGGATRTILKACPLPVLMSH